MEFEGEDQRTLNKLVRTLSGRLDFLIDGDQPRGGAGGASPAEDSRTVTLSEDVSEKRGKERYVVGGRGALFEVGNG